MSNKGTEFDHSTLDAIFVSLSLAYFATPDILQFHPFSCKWHNFIFYGWIKLHCVCVYIYMYLILLLHISCKTQTIYKILAALVSLRYFHISSRTVFLCGSQHNRQEQVRKGMLKDSKGIMKFCKPDCRVIFG
jgi:hypothetical protein